MTTFYLNTSHPQFHVVSKLRILGQIHKKSTKTLDEFVIFFHSRQTRLYWQSEGTPAPSTSSHAQRSLNLVDSLCGQRRSWIVSLSFVTVCAVQNESEQHALEMLVIRVLSKEVEYGQKSRDFSLLFLDLWVCECLQEHTRVSGSEFQPGTSDRTYVEFVIPAGGLI